MANRYDGNARLNDGETWLRFLADARQTLFCTFSRSFRCLRSLLFSYYRLNIPPTWRTRDGLYFVGGEENLAPRWESHPSHPTSCQSLHCLKNH